MKKILLIDLDIHFNYANNFQVYLKSSNYPNKEEITLTSTSINFPFITLNY